MGNCFCKQNTDLDDQYDDQYDYQQIQPKQQNKKLNHYPIIEETEITFH